MRRILFLDIDGVLNSTEFFKRTEFEARGERPGSMIDETCVGRLNRLLYRIQADVVFSSSWRIHFSQAEIVDGLQQHGFRGDVIGITPKYLGCRGNEIQAWLTARGRSADDCVILDDSSDMAHLIPRLIRTSNDVGLTDADCDRAVALFSEATK